MKIKLKTGFCEVRECDLTLEQQTLHLTGENTHLSIPLCDLTRFVMTASGPGPQRFQLELGDKLYQGKFLHQKDGHWLAQQLGQYGSHCVQIIFDKETI